MKNTGELHSLKTPEGPWQEISINVIEPLPKSHGKDVIVVIVYIGTKFGNYMEYYKQFLTTKDHSLCHNL